MVDIVQHFLQEIHECGLKVEPVVMFLHLPQVNMNAMQNPWGHRHLFGFPDIDVILVVACMYCWRKCKLV